MRNLSSAGLASIHAQETVEIWVPLAKLSHPGWSEDVRLVGDYNDLIHDGDLFQAFPFTVNLPDEHEEGLPVLQWVADNSNLELIAQLRQVASVSGYVQVQIAWVRVDDPDTLEIGWLDLEMRSVEYDAQVITGSLTVEPVLDAAFGVTTFNPTNAPALF